MNYIFRCDMNGIPFLYPGLKLGNAEIAKICHEISTNYDKYTGREFIMHRTRDLEGFWCIYYVENHGYGDYNIIDKYSD